MKRTPDESHGQRLTSTGDEGGTAEGRAGTIEQQAAEWVARIDLRGTPDEWAALDAWLAANPRHRAAFLRLSVAWRRADQLKRLAPLDGVVDVDLLDPARLDNAREDDDLEDSPLERADAPEHADTPHSPARAGGHVRTLRVVASTAKPVASDRQWAAVQRYRARAPEPANDDGATASRFGRLTPSRLAASVAVLAVAVAGALYAYDRGGADVYSTRIGEFHRVSLSDGSTVGLNTNSEVRVRYTDGARHVDLVRGEAVFEVAKDSARPFDVVADSTRVRAVGTAFSVRLHEEKSDERVDIVVSEGRIAINPPASETYAAGTVATVRNGRVNATTVDAADITSRLAWTHGRLVFQGEKLSDVVVEINRYNLRKLRVADADIANVRIGGTFLANDPDGFARALERSLGIKSVNESRQFGADEIRLVSGVP